MKLSVVIPAFNEEKRLPQTLREIRPYLDAKKIDYEVLIADDGSRDQTVAVALDEKMKWPQLHVIAGHGHAGKGATVKRGVRAARGENILVMDADHATPIRCFDLLLPHRADNEVVVGVRMFCGKEGASGKGRRIIGLLQLLLSHAIVFKNSVADSQCGFKLFSREAAVKIFSRSQIQGGMYDVEIFFIAQKLGISIFSQPVEWVNKGGSTINIPQCVFFDPFSLISIRWFDLLRQYR